MLLKRSVSPDRRIDSLSVEFSPPLDSEPSEAVRARAEQLMELQSSIVARFLSRHEAPAPQPVRTDDEPGQPPKGTRGTQERS